MVKVLFSFFLLFSLNVMALDKMPFNEKQFKSFQDQGIPVLIDVYAIWCPTCERQQIILKRYFDENPNSPVKVMVVDFDDNKKWVRHFKAPRQSTLFLYQHHQQQWLSVAETRTRVIEKALNKYLPAVNNQAKVE
ncbi:MAG: thioredoxin family protein [Pseudomonadales bacterium]|nr:thioredoxin family protein [Pseudomonadales bacterium]